MYSEKELLENIEKQLASGHTAVKIKLGRENEDEDIQRIKAVRKLIGDEALFMVDGQYGLDRRAGYSNGKENGRI